MKFIKTTSYADPNDLSINHSFRTDYNSNNGIVKVKHIIRKYCITKITETNVFYRINISKFDEELIELHKRIVTGIINGEFERYVTRTTHKEFKCVDNYPPVIVRCR